MKKAFSHLIVSLLWLLPVPLCFSPAKDLPSQSALVQRDTASWNQLLRTSLRAASDSIGQRAKSEIEALQKKSDRAADNASGVLRGSAERLVKEAGDSLSPQRRDTLRNLVRVMEKALASSATNTGRSAEKSLHEFQKGMLALERRYSNCDDCENSQDVQSILDDYLAGSDSLVEILHQAWEDLTESVDDSLDAFRDKLDDIRSDMIDRQEEENEYAAAHSTRIVVSGSYVSDVVYRGRDGGMKQSSLSPELAYKHRSGLFVAGSAGWLSNSVHGWDVRNIGGGYEFELGPHFTGRLSYTHFWFNDSSRQEKAEFTNSLDCELAFFTKPVNVFISPSLAFATSSESTTEFSLSHEFDVDRFLGRAALSIEPTVTAIVGEQNASVTQKRLLRQAAKKGKTTAVVASSTKNKNFFGILDYEFAVPIVLEYGNVALSPTFAYAFPVNVVDASNTAPFFYFSFGASYTIR